MSLTLMYNFFIYLCCLRSLLDCYKREKQFMRLASGMNCLVIGSRPVMMNRQNLLVSFKRHNVTFHGQFSIIFFHPVSVSLWRVDADAHVAGFLLYLLTIYTDNAVYVEINTLDSYSFIRSRGRVHCSDIRRAKQNR